MYEEPEDQRRERERTPAPPLVLAGVEDDPGEWHIVRGID
ncbi:hypothetical protein SUDANB145_00951 [Streptomyces sp. enrichment culture]